MWNKSELARQTYSERLDRGGTQTGVEHHTEPHCSRHV